MIYHAGRLTSARLFIPPCVVIEGAVPFWQFSPASTSRPRRSLLSVCQPAKCTMFLSNGKSSEESDCLMVLSLDPDLDSKKIMHFYSCMTRRGYTQLDHLILTLMGFYSSISCLACLWSHVPDRDRAKQLTITPLKKDVSSHKPGPSADLQCQRTIVECLVSRIVRLVVYPRGLVIGTRPCYFTPPRSTAPQPRPPTF